MASLKVWIDSARETKYFPLILLSIFSLILTLLQYYIGIEYSLDSSYYATLSNRIANHADFSRGLVVYAPLFPFALGGLQYLSLTHAQSILVYWFVSFFLLHLSFYKATNSVRLSVLCMFATMSNPLVFQLFRYVWTELGFASLLALSCILGFTILNKTKISSFKSIAIFSVLIGLLPTMKYIGIYTSIFLGSCVLILEYLRANKEGKPPYHIVPLVLSSIPFSLVILWNYLADGHIGGKRKPSSLSFLSTLQQTFEVLSRYFVIELIAATASLAFAMYLLFRSRKNKDSTLALLIVSMVPILLPIMLAYERSVHRFDKIGPRFFVYLTPTILITFLLCIQYLLRKYNSQRHHSIQLIALIFIIFANFTYGDFHLISRRSEKTYQKFKPIREILDKAPNRSKVVVSCNGQNKYYASLLVFSERIVPKRHCQKYHVANSISSRSLFLRPSCKTKEKDGHVYYTKLPREKNNSIDYIITDDKDTVKQFSSYYAKQATISSLHLLRKIR